MSLSPHTLPAHPSCHISPIRTEVWKRKGLSKNSASPCQVKGLARRRLSEMCAFSVAQCLHHNASHSGSPEHGPSSSGLSPKQSLTKELDAGGLIGRCPRKQKWKRGPGVGSEIGKEEEPI